MLHDFIINLFIEFAVVSEDCIHLLELFHNEAVLVYDGLDGDPPAHKHLVNRDELAQLPVINHLLEL